MAKPDWSRKRGDTDSPLDFVLTTNDQPLAMLGTENVKLFAKPITGGPVKINRACTFVDATAGHLRCEPSAEEMDTAGLYQVEVEVLAGDRRRTFPDGSDRDYMILAIYEDIGDI